MINGAVLYGARLFGDLHVVPYVATFTDGGSHPQSLDLDISRALALEAGDEGGLTSEQLQQRYEALHALAHWDIQRQLRLGLAKL